MQMTPGSWRIAVQDFSYPLHLALWMRDTLDLIDDDPALPGRLDWPVAVRSHPTPQRHRDWRTWWQALLDTSAEQTFPELWIALAPDELAQVTRMVVTEAMRDLSRHRESWRHPKGAPPRVPINVERVMPDRNWLNRLGAFSLQVDLLHTEGTDVLQPLPHRLLVPRAVFEGSDPSWLEEAIRVLTHRWPGAPPGPR